MEQKAKPVFCKNWMRDPKLGLKTPCIGLVINGTCINKANHLHLTGWCSVGSHEGSDSRSVSGKALPTCTDWLKCSCACHEKVSRDFIAAGETRKPIEGSYVPARTEMYIPSRPKTAREYADMYNLIWHPSFHPEIPDMVTDPEADEETLQTHWLDEAVQLACNFWIRNGKLLPWTVNLISVRISAEMNVDPPSPGAIDAVLKRWEQIGFANVGHKPRQFLGYTEEGIRMSLLPMLAERREQKRKEKFDQIRGVKV